MLNSKAPPLGNKAVEFIDTTKPLFFNLKGFFLKDSPHPAQDIVNANTLKIGVTDVYFTGLAAKFCILRYMDKNVLKNTKKKVQEFLEIIAQNNNNILAPAAIRQIAFFNANKFKDSEGEIKMDAETDNDLLHLLSIFRNAKFVRQVVPVLGANYNGTLSLEKANELYEAVVPLLTANRSRLQHMLDEIEES